MRAPFKDEEFRIAIFQMAPDKSPGPDGLNPKIYRCFWSLIGPEVCRACRSWLEKKEFPPTLTDTMVVLIPKCESPQTMQELRPISLCNVLYCIG